MGEDTIMAVAELKQSRTSKNGKERTLLYSVTGSNDDTVAEAALLTAAPAVYRGLPRADYMLEWIGDEIWTAELNYKLVTSPDQQQEPGNVGSTAGQVTLTFAGETVHRKTSDETVAKYPAGAPDYDNAIGVSLEGGNWEIAGTDVLIPKITYSETHYYHPASVTQTYRKTIIELTGTVNDATWKGFDAGEVRFDGATFTLSDGEKITATYNFSMSLNETGLSVGDVSGIDKDGWDHMWIRYKPTTSANQLLAKAEAVYIERVYKRKDFSLLQIGT